MIFKFERMIYLNDLGEIERTKVSLYFFNSFLYGKPEKVGVQICMEARFWLFPYWQPDFNHINWMLEAWGLEPTEVYSEYLRDKLLMFEDE